MRRPHQLSSLPQTFIFFAISHMPFFFSSSVVVAVSHAYHCICHCCSPMALIPFAYQAELFLSGFFLASIFSSFFSFASSGIPDSTSTTSQWRPQNSFFTAFQLTMVTIESAELFFTVFWQTSSFASCQSTSFLKAWTPLQEQRYPAVTLLQKTSV